MKYRILTLDEVAGLVAVAEAAAHWSAYRKFALEYYGERSHKITTATGQEYNDETYDDRIAYINVYDVDGNELDPDLTLAAWAAPIARHNKAVAENARGFYTKYPEEREFDPDDTLYDARSELPTLQNDETEFVFYVNTPPDIPRIAIIEED
jgi:hypothetical protein